MILTEGREGDHRYTESWIKNYFKRRKRIWHIEKEIIQNGYRNTNTDSNILSTTWKQKQNPEIEVRSSWCKIQLEDDLKALVLCSLKCNTACSDLSLNTWGPLAGISLRQDCSGHVTPKRVSHGAIQNTAHPDSELLLPLLDQFTYILHPFVL